MAVQALRLAEREDGGGEGGLERGVAAGEGHAAARRLVERAVPQHLRGHFLCGLRLAGQHQPLCEALLDALSADDALRPVVDVPPLRIEDLPAVRTHRDARAAADAARGVEADFGLRADAFRVMAPEAAQIAALEKDGRTNARAVVDGEALDVGRR